MKRRKFLQSMGVGIGAAVIIPTILLPSPKELNERFPGQKVREVVPNDRFFVTIAHCDKPYRGKKVRMIIHSESYNVKGNSYPRKGDLVMFDANVMGYVIDKEDAVPFNHTLSILPIKYDATIPRLKYKQQIVIVGNSFCSRN